MIYHVFANKSNVGDWLSARAIQTLIGPLEVAELCCDTAFVRTTLKRLASATPNDFVIIGGGGLFQEYFLPFWKGFEELARRVPFCIWGVGVCQMKQPAECLQLFRRIADLGRLCSLRDEMTHQALDVDAILPPIACPSMTLLQPSADRPGGLLHAVHPDLVDAATRRSIASMCENFSHHTRRTYRETQNIITPGDERALANTLGRYASADLVVSSRLHGCIIGLAMGCKVLAVSFDPKVKAFMEAAGLKEWACQPTDLPSLHERLAALPAQSWPRQFVESAIESNKMVAKRIRGIMTENCIDPNLDAARLTAGSHAWDVAWMKNTAQRLVDVIPPGEAFILLDDSLPWPADSFAASRVVEFASSDGACWGPPADDAEAIRVLQELRRSSANHIAFAAPALWWLDHYSGFHRYLRGRFRCVIESEDLVAFDLREETPGIEPAFTAAESQDRRQILAKGEIASQLTADYERWSTLDNFDPRWDPRTRAMALLVPEGSRVIEFGAGRRQLEKYLDPSCTYFPSDLLDRGPGTIVCDLNVTPLPDFRGLNLTAAVFSGVLEYLTQLESIARWLADQVSQCAIVSYACANSTPGTPQRENEVLSRARNGWVNTYGENEIIGIFESAGFDCRERHSWESQRIFVLHKLAVFD